MESRSTCSKAIGSRALQWGRGPETAERRSVAASHSRSRRRASMGPRSGDRGESLAPGSHRGLSQPCFNGAAVRRPRRARRVSPRRHALARASTGPRSETAESSQWHRIAPPLGALQRGRGPETAESRIHGTRPMPCHASTGPRSGDRGELRARSRLVGVHWLQRGRGPETAESAGLHGSANWRVRRASTGPRSETAESRRRNPMPSRARRFNGAAVRRPRRAHRPSARTCGALQRGRGRRPRRERCRTRRRRLQWGRGPETAESGAAGRYGTCASMGPRSGPRRASASDPDSASMGPRSGDRGDAPRRVCSAAARSRFNGAAVRRPRRAACSSVAEIDAANVPSRASMGPRSVRPRRVAGARDAAASTSASMGPRSEDRGEDGAHGADRRRMTGFNGAAVGRPRRGGSRGASSTDASFNGAAVGRPRRASSGFVGARGSRASTGPRSEDRGEDRLRVRSHGTRRCFNGAAVRRPRRVAVDCSMAVAVRSASTGPRSEDRGERSRRRQLQRLDRERFNGAAVGRPRRALDVQRAPRWTERLQRGRGPKTAESACDAACIAGARLLQRGRGRETAESRRELDASASRSLQWGRGPETAESTSARRAGASALQRGRGPETAESAVRGMSAPALRFNGAAVRRPRRARDSACRCGVRRRCFNGAAVGDRGEIPQRRRADGAHRHRFNGAAVRRPRRARDARHQVGAVAVCFNGAAVRRPRRDCAASPMPRARGDGFNGAAVRRPRRGRVQPRSWRRCSVLQWGRGR